MSDSGLPPPDPAELKARRGAAKACEKAGDLEGQVRAWRSVLELVPKDPDIHAKLAKLFTGAGRNSDAMPHLRAVAEETPDDDRGWRVLARALADAGDIAGEAEVQQRRLALDPADESTRLRLSHLLVQLGRPDEAAAQLRPMVEAPPEDDDGWRRLARALAEAGDVDGEIEALRRRLDRGAGDAAARQRLVRLLIQQDRRAEAVPHLAALAEAAPADLEAWRRLARVQQDEADPAGEAATLARMLALFGHDANLRHRLAVLLEQLGRREEAVAHLRVLAETPGDDAAAWRRLRRLLAELERPDQEIEVLRRLLATAGATPADQARLVEVLERGGRKAAAAAQLWTMVGAADAGSRALRTLVRLLRETGDVDGEIRALRLKLELEGDDLAAHSRLAALLEAAGRRAEAVTHLRALAEASPGHAAGWRRLVRALAVLGDVDGEISAIERRLETAGPDVASHSRLAHLRTLQGRRDLAVPHLLAVAEADPGQEGRWRPLMRTFGELGDVEGEINALRRRLELTGGDPAVHARLARSLMDLDRNREAAPHLRAAAEGSPEDAALWVRLSRLLSDIEDNEGELHALQHCVRLKDDDSVLQSRLAVLLLQAGRAVEAEPHMRRAGDPTGELAGAWRALARSFTTLGDGSSATAAWTRVLAYLPGDEEACRSLGPGASAAAPSHFAPATFIAIVRDEPCAGVSNEAGRINDLLDFWSRLQTLDAEAAGGSAEVLFTAVLSRLGVIVRTYSTSDPLGLGARAHHLRQIFAAAPFQELARRFPTALAEFATAGSDDWPNLNALLDPALAMVMAPRARGAGSAAMSPARRRLSAAVGRGRRLAASTQFDSPVLICGFHHSGTRLLAQLLHAAGVFQFVNRQTFEWNYVQVVNTEMLPGWANEAAIERFAPSQAAARIEPRWLALRLAAAGYDGDRPWAQKDPRNCLTAAAWLTAFPRARVLNVVRNPMDVIGSMPPTYSRHAPGGVIPQQAAGYWAGLWRAYLARTRQAMADAELASEVRFESLCADPAGEVGRILAELELTGCSASTAAEIPIRAGRVGSYLPWVERGDLAPDQLEMLRQLAAEHGYAD